MKNSKRFYTYAYLREDGTPYYIGKGTGKRIYENKGRPCGKPTNKSRIIFLKQNLTEEDAFKHEVYMIAIFGRKDLGKGILYNKSDGGEGPSGRLKTEKEKEHIRNMRIGTKHSEETKLKMSNKRKGELHPMFGKKRPDIINLNHQRKGKKLNLNNFQIENRSQKKIGNGNPMYDKKGKDNPNFGKKWWNNGIENSFGFDCPGENWVRGMLLNKNKQN